MCLLARPSSPPCLGLNCSHCRLYRSTCSESLYGRLCEGKPTRMRSLCLKNSEAAGWSEIKGGWGGWGGSGITSSSNRAYALTLLLLGLKNIHAFSRPLWSIAHDTVVPPTAAWAERWSKYSHIFFLFPLNH